MSDSQHEASVEDLEANDDTSDDEGSRAESSPTSKDPQHASSSPPGEPSANGEKNQSSESTLAPPAGKPLTPAVYKASKRLRALHAELAEKERLQLSYLYEKIPKPYYDRWKEEGNDIFSLAVNVSRRVKSQRRKSGG